MKKILISLTALATALAVSGSGLLPIAQAAVNVNAVPSSMVSNAIALPPSSAQTALFTFTLGATAGESLSSVSVQVNKANSLTTVSGSHIASVSIYKDDGSNIFTPSAANFIGSQSSVNIGSPTTITPNSFTSASGKFYISLATSAFWSQSQPADSITVSLPNNAITTSANSPSTGQITTAAITAGPAVPQLISAVAQNTGGSSAKEGGDSVVLTFSEATNKFGVTAGNINNQFTLSNGHGFADSLGNINSLSWNNDGSSLTIVLSGPNNGSPALAMATVMPGDVVTMSPNTGITDLAGNKATGSVSIAGSFGSNVGSLPSVFTQLSANNVPINTPVHDTAVLANTSANAGGAVTYNVYVINNCSGSPVFSDVQAVTNGSVPASRDFSTTATGTYYWQAAYSGDANNLAATSDCQSEALFVGVNNPGNPINPPAVLGSTNTSLPRTGVPVGLLFLSLALVAGLVEWKLKPI